MNLFIPKSFPFAAQVSAALFHYAEKLGISDIPFSVSLETAKLGDAYAAECELQDMHFVSNPEIIIRVDFGSLYSFSYLAVKLAHEMVHVRQYVKKEITFAAIKGSQGKTKYKEFFKGERVDNISYLDKPCEKQALRLEGRLFISFLQSAAI